MVESKYYKAWEQYRAENPEVQGPNEDVIASRIQSYEERMFGFIMFLIF
jgi:hypothetical protein